MIIFAKVINGYSNAIKHDVFWETLNKVHGNVVSKLLRNQSS